MSFAQTVAGLLQPRRPPYCRGREVCCTSPAKEIPHRRGEIAPEGDMQVKAMHGNGLR